MVTPLLAVSRMENSDSPSSPEAGKTPAVLVSLFSAGQTANGRGPFSPTDSLRINDDASLD